MPALRRCTWRVPLSSTIRRSRKPSPTKSGHAGADLRLGAQVVSLSADGSAVRIGVAHGADLAADVVVNCAGLASDRVASLLGGRPPVRIIPFRGEYYVLRPEAAGLVRGLIYPVADPRLPFLGVHLTRGIDQSVHVGPNAVLALSREGYRRGDIALRDTIDVLRYAGFWRRARTYGGTGIDEVLMVVLTAALRGQRGPPGPRSDGG